MVGPASLRKASCKEITGGPQILGRIPPLIKVRRRFELFLLLFASTVRPGCSVPPHLHRTTPTHNPLRALDLHHCRPGDQQRLRTCLPRPLPPDAAFSPYWDWASTEPPDGDTGLGERGCSSPGPQSPTRRPQGMPWGSNRAAEQGNLSLPLILACTLFTRFIEMISFDKSWMWEGKDYEKRISG